MLKLVTPALPDAGPFSGPVTLADLIALALTGSLVLAFFLIAFATITAIASGDKERRECAMKIFRDLLRFFMDIIRAIFRIIRGLR